MEFGETYKNWLQNLSEQPAGISEERDLNMVWEVIEEELILDEAWTGIDTVLGPVPTTGGSVSSPWNGIFSRSGFVIFLGVALISFLLLWQSDSFIQPRDEFQLTNPEISSAQNGEVTQTESIDKEESSLNSKITPVASVKNEPAESLKNNDSFTAGRFDTGKSVMEEAIDKPQRIDSQEEENPSSELSGTRSNADGADFSGYTVTPPGNNIAMEPVISSGLNGSENDSRETGEESYRDSRTGWKPVDVNGWAIPRSLLHFELPAMDFMGGGKSTLRLRKWRWHGAGISLSYNNSWIMNNETLAGLDPSDLNDTRLSYAPEIGFSTVFASSKDYRLEMEFFVLSEQSQRMNQYINALYQERELSLHYHKAHLSWQMPLWIVPGKIGIGGYYALLSRAEEIIAGQIRRVDEFYTKEDYGFTLQYKLEYDLFSGFVLAPSLRAQYSLHNIFNGNEAIPGFLRKTHNASMGINLGIYYRF